MENVNMKYRNSDAYIGSVYTESSDAMNEIQVVRDTVRKCNAYLKGIDAPRRYRVTLKGREPIEHGYTRFGDIVGGIKNAGRIDIYIHERRD